jgi:hypothetical protein
MTRGIAVLALMGVAILSSCARKESSDALQSATEVPAVAQPAGGAHAFVYLKDGSKVPGTIVASSQTEMVVAGDDGIERKIPMTQIKSVEYGGGPTAAPAGQFAPPPEPAVTTRTYELPPGREISVRTNETIDSGTAAEGQTFDAQATRDARDANGELVIPRGSGARIIIRSASRGGRFRGASDLVLDLQSVVINGRHYAIDTVDIGLKGKSGVGANKRTAEYTGGGAALGAIIGAIAGGGKGAAIGAGAGGGAGVLTQVLTKGRAIRVPAESVLTFRLDRPLRVIAAE